MAWFGEGFSSLKGQITNFTKEIVSNNLSIDDPDETENANANKKLNTHIQQLEAHCRDQDDEINKLRLENLQLRKLFADGSPRDRLHSEEATFECGLDTCGNTEHLSSWEEVVAEPFLGQDPVCNARTIPKFTKLDEELTSLRSRLRQTFQEKVLLEQSCSRLEKDVSLLSEQVHKSKQKQEEAAGVSRQRCHQTTQTGSSSGCDTSDQICHCITPQISSLLQDNDRLKQEKVQMRQEMTVLSRLVQDLESQVAVSQDENSNLSTGLEELDIRHQQEIEQIMNLKDSTQKNYDILLAENEELKNKYEEMVNENLSRKNVTVSSDETQACKPEYGINGEEAEEIFKKKMAEKIQSLILFSIPQEFFVEDETNDFCMDKIKALINMCVDLKETVEGLRTKEQNLIQEIKERDEELQGLESENVTLREKLKEFSKERESLPPILENSEELEVLEHKCSMLENENAILIENRSNLEADINKSRAQVELLVQQLRAFEAETKNYENLQTEILRYKDTETELREEINKMLTEKKDLVKCKGELQSQLETLQHVTEDYEGLKQELAELKLIEIEIKKVNEELEMEKSLRLKVEAEKEELLLDHTRLSNDIEIKDNIICKLEQEKSMSLLLEGEKEDLLNELAKLKEFEKLYGNINEELEKEKSIRNQLKEEKEKLITDVVRLEELENNLRLKLERSESANDLKIKSLSQKYKTIESRLLDQSEKSDTLKLESEIKDRKLCEVILEKSVLEKESEQLKLAVGQLTEELSNIKKTDNDEAEHLKIVELQEKIVLLETEKSVLSKEKEELILELNDKRNQLYLLQNNSVTTSEPLLVNSKEESALAVLQIEKDQLVQSLQAKHMENVHYHSEIQRLNTLLSAQLNKTEQMSATCAALTKANVELQQNLDAKDAVLTSQQTVNDKQISMLKQQVETLQNQLEYVSQLLRVADRQEAEGQPASDSPSLSTSNKIIPAEVDCNHNIEELLDNLKKEQLRNKYLQNEVQEQHEKEQGSLKEIERLRIHLVNVEDTYTQELVRAEEQIKDLQLKLSQADERVKSSSTAYTSASIRANQQVESLGKQVRLLSEQKEKISTQLATAEDKLHKQAAALTNLQIVLEQFQKDKERDIDIETERIKQTVQQAENKNRDLQNEIKSLQMQLKEAKEGLSAASRLSEQLDKKSETIAELKQKVTELNEALTKAEARVHAAGLSVEGKVDKCLVRNLIVGYLCAPVSSRQQALSIVSTVLDLSPEDRQKIGLQPQSGSKADDHRQQSLSEAFVRFLENESRPQTHLRLPLVDSDKEPRSRKTSLSEVGLPNARRTSGSILKDVLK